MPESDPASKTPVDKITELTLICRSGEMHVLLDPGGDHIVTKFVVSPKGYQSSKMLPRESWVWDRAVARASRAAAFL